VDAYRALFPITERFAYLDHAAMGPPSRPVIAAQQEFIERQATLGSEMSPEIRAAKDRLRRAMAEFIGADPEEIAFTKNTPEGISIVASGLGWRPGDSVVTTDLEFPANMYPWLNLRERGVEVRIVETESGRVPLDALIAACDATTRVLAISLVQFSTGFRSDLSKLAEHCRPRGIFLVTDAIQAAGVLPIDVHALGVDFLACASHKWLLAPFGMGWFYCRRELLERLSLVEIGGTSMVERPSFLDYQIDLKPTAERFECGMINATGMPGLQASLDLFNQVGRGAVEHAVLALTDRLVAGLEQRGYGVYSSRRPGEASGIVVFESDRRPASEIRQQLHEAGVICSVREGRVRVSPHFYNSAEDIDRLLEALPTLA
jgi:selenocysteine lyase/cysteine desulfurase